MMWHMQEGARSGLFEHFKSEWWFCDVGIEILRHWYILFSVNLQDGFVALRVDAFWSWTDDLDERLFADSRIFLNSVHRGPHTCTYCKVRCLRRSRSDSEPYFVITDHCIFPTQNLMI